MMPTTKICHISDLHLSTAPKLGEYNLKRLFGRLNWKFGRGNRHDPTRLATAVEKIIGISPDCVVITGDLGQLGLPEEVWLAREFIAPLRDAAIPTLVVSGNHDHYGSDAESAFSELKEEVRLGLKPDNGGLFVVGNVEILLLEQGCTSPVFCAYGRLDREALRDAEKYLEQSEGQRRIRIAAGHYPLQNTRGVKLPKPYALDGGEELARVLRDNKFSAYLCGHLHQPYLTDLPGGCIQNCAGSITGKGCITLLTAGDMLEIEQIN